MFFIEKDFYKKITKNYEWPIMEELSLFFYDNTNDPFSFLFFCYLCIKFF